ncbi:monocarboxylate transporter 9-like [Mizuhopecten yessoensis]|uniref:Monocarboxylate transporter 12 n=1 Tax=Mizuhopecten yessoensis TaxID=6573 RepID=A0A210PV20_MIZYE|nr:monocarboxylate transporter 9-like [Mizuhopecten yessoensis]XP_021374587.1 monocarboxylate transporter 9-like [Mizuhopecten yessoensis]XP_021374588.1 monocarboxylate transporter 9-like [Mizuhopecten yessoensis]XP_021374589.1 monocarboxylate transporter 9-like [Mizuhopecten yessoensis]OWF40338.1 Monocarboxylate transporter 12 [Mizuhopecten yessoensis]
MLTQPDKGWAWVVMVASFFIHCLNAGMLYGTGIIQVALLERFQKGLAVTSWAGAIYIFLMFGAGLIGSVLINQFSCRVAFLVGSVIMTSGLLASSFAESLEVLIISYGFTAGLGSGIVFTSGIVVVGLNFQKKRSVATGFASCGAGAGAFIFPPLIQLAREEYGDSGFFILLAGMALNISVFGSLCFPSYLEFNKNAPEMTASTLSLSLHSLTKRQHFCKLISLLRNLPFVCICLSQLASHIGIYMMYVHIPNFAILQGSTDAQASILLSVSGIMNCVSRLLVGMAGNADNISNIVLYFGTFGMLGISTVLFPLYGNTYIGQITYSVILGTYSGSCYVLLSTITTEMVGIEFLVSAFGIAMIFTGFGTLMGPPLAGFIVDGGGTYELSFTLAGCCILLAAVLGIAAEVFRRIYYPDEVVWIKDRKTLKPHENHSLHTELIPQQKANTLNLYHKENSSHEVMLPLQTDHKIYTHEHETGCIH